MNAIDLVKWKELAIYEKNAELLEKFEKFMYNALKIKESLYGEYDKNTIESYEILAAYYFSMCETSKRKEILSLISKRTEILGFISKRASALDELRTLAGDEGNVESVFEIITTIIKDSVKNFGENHKETAILLQDLSEIFFKAWCQP